MQVTTNCEISLVIEEIIPHLLEEINWKVFGDIRISVKNKKSRFKGLYYISNRYIIINTHENNVANCLLTLFHETVHANQHFRGDLDVYEEGFTWRGRLYPFENYNQDYEKLPFEREAFAKQLKIYRNVIQRCDLKLLRKIKELI